MKGCYPKGSLKMGHIFSPNPSLVYSFTCLPTYLCIHLSVHLTCHMSSMSHATTCFSGPQGRKYLERANDLEIPSATGFSLSSCMSARSKSFWPHIQCEPHTPVLCQWHPPQPLPRCMCPVSAWETGGDIGPHSAQTRHIHWWGVRRGSWMLLGPEDTQPPHLLWGKF